MLVLLTEEYINGLFTKVAAVLTVETQEDHNILKEEVHPDIKLVLIKAEK